MRGAHATYTCRRVAGGPDDFMEVRHLVASGSSRAIGHALADEAAKSFGASANPTPDAVLTRARRRWFARNWPEHHEHMLGYADAFGVDPDDEMVDLGELVAMPFAPGCSTVWCPPGAAVDGKPRVARNYDFSTGSVFDVLAMTGRGAPGAYPGQPAMTSRPYVVELYPDDGYASVMVCAYDLSGAIEGINEHGLTITLLADDESTNLVPALQPQVGIHELQLPRFVLDRCTSASDARDALYDAKQYDEFFPCHYLVADAGGDAFVWERDTHNAEHVVNSGDRPLCVTNHMLHRCRTPDEVPDDLPGDDFRSNTYRRARVLNARVADGRLSAESLREAVDAVRMDGSLDEALPVPGRTLWQAMYGLAERTVTIEFYLGDGPDGSLRYSPPLVFRLA